MKSLNLIILISLLFISSPFIKTKKTTKDYDPSVTLLEDNDDIILNMDPNTIDTVLSKSDYLNFIYVLDSENDKSK